MSIAAAQAKLAGLVKGSLIGVRVTKRDGASPRVVRAVVVGTGGQTTVSGLELQQRFGLLSTLARFTTVTTTHATVSRGFAAGHSPDISRITAETAAALVHHLFARGKPVISGRAFPAARGARLFVQAHRRSGWRTVRRATLGAGGWFAVPVPGPGSYRVVVDGLPGPAVNAG
jgi:hypothetical protein